MSSSFTLIGTALLTALLAGYVAQRYLPNPKPRVAGIDLGTTFSSIGLYHPVTGQTEIIADFQGRRSIPSVVAFLENGTILVGHDALAQSEKNPQRTVYDAKRFIGKQFPERNSEQFQREIRRYSFDVDLDENGRAFFLIPMGNDSQRKVTPEEIGSLVILHLLKMVFDSTKGDLRIKQAVISVPAEFDEQQRNYTRKAAELAGLDILRIISEPTAAALAYGLHTKKGVDYVIVIDVGGGTLDVSVLWLQGQVFVTQSMAGNNRLGGQDFNERMLTHILKIIKNEYKNDVVDKEDLQNLRLAIEQMKIRLTFYHSAKMDLRLHTIGRFQYEMKRREFESLNADLFASVLAPMHAALEDAELTREDIDEIVLVGGSTRIPMVRKVVGEFFGKAPNYGVDPELAVVMGVTVQAGVVGDGWPLTAAALELPSTLRKRHVYVSDDKEAKKR